MAIEQTVAMVKPDGVAHNLTYEVMRFYEFHGLTVLDMRVFVFSIPVAMEFYEEHAGRPFYRSLIHHMTSGPTVAFFLQGEDAIAHVRELNGATNPEEATQDSLRHQFLVRALFDRKNRAANFVHGSDSLAAAVRESKLLGFV